MVLNRERKEGQLKEPITKNEIKLELAIALTVGNLAFGSMMLSLVSLQNRSKENINYTEQVEKLFNENIDDNIEIVLNKMTENANLIDKYNSTSSSLEKDECLEKLASDKDNFRKMGLQLVKMKIAKKNGGSWDEYIVQEGEDYVSWQALRTTYDKYGIDHHELVTLDRDSANLVDAIIALDNSPYLNEQKNNKNADKFIKDYQSVINKSVKIISKSAEKLGKGN